MTESKKGEELDYAPFQGDNIWIGESPMQRQRHAGSHGYRVIFFFIGAPLGGIIRKGGLGMPVVVSVLIPWS